MCLVVVSFPEDLCATAITLVHLAAHVIDPPQAVKDDRTKGALVTPHEYLQRRRKRRILVQGNGKT